MSDVPDNDVSYAERGAGTETLELLESAQAYNRWIVDLLRPYLGAANAELGAGQGTLTEIVGETHRVLPFELSSHNRTLLQRRFAESRHVVPCQADLLEYPAWASLDCIYSANVIEHIEDDMAVIRHAARLLKPNGWFVAFAPAGKWLYSAFDRELGHHRRYGDKDRNRLRRIVNGDAELTLREFRYVNVPGALGWFVRMKLLGNTRVRDRDVAMVERLLPVIRLLDTFKLPFGQSVLIALQRRESAD
jgi:SAM-dependent methyltransferase